MLNLSGTVEHNEVTIREFVREWTKLLAQERLEEACALLDEPNCYGLVWTPERILEVVHDTFSPGTHFHHFHPEGPVFTDPDELEAQNDREVWARDDGTEYGFDYDLPLNHEWSDLTAQFEFHKRPNGFAVVLHDLHVM
jgi:hypothetical protein